MIIVTAMLVVIAGFLGGCVIKAGLDWTSAIILTKWVIRRNGFMMQQHKDDRLCSMVKVDQVTLQVVDGILTAAGKKQPITAINAPCGGFKMDADVFKIGRGGRITIVGGDETAEAFTICGTASFDTNVFKMTKDMVLSMNTVCMPAAETQLLGMSVGKLMMSGGYVEEDGSVVATLRPIEGWKEFSSVEELQSGYYFPLVLGVSGEKMTLKKDGEVTKQDAPFDNILVLRVESTETTHTIEVDGEEVITLNFTKSTLAE